jgi:rubrerythrin
MSELDLLKDSDLSSVDGGQVIRRLKVALGNELEASELAVLWMATTPEVDIKLALARQAGDEARHYRLIEEHLSGLGADLSEFDPVSGGYTPMFKLLAEFDSTVERVAAAQFTRESLALKKNEQFIEFCDAVGASGTADFYLEQIQPDEKWHVEMGKTALGKHAVTPELQDKARSASQSVLELAVKIQNKQLHEMKISHAPGC